MIERINAAHNEAMTSDSKPNTQVTRALDPSQIRFEAENAEERKEDDHLEFEIEEEGINAHTNLNRHF